MIVEIDKLMTETKAKSWAPFAVIGLVLCILVGAILPSAAARFVALIVACGLCFAGGFFTAISIAAKELKAKS